MTNFVHLINVCVCVCVTLCARYYVCVCVCVCLIHARGIFRRLLSNKVPHIKLGEQRRLTG